MALLLAAFDHQCTASGGATVRGLDSRGGAATSWYKESHMSASASTVKLVETAALLMKSDLAGALEKLTIAYVQAANTSNTEDAGLIAEELARGWTRRKSPARSLYYAYNATELSPERKAAWTTLAKTCELIATRVRGDDKRLRAKVLYRAAGAAFKKAASLTKDPEDRRWLTELARDAARLGKPAG
jgi:hypothetical protein